MANIDGSGRQLKIIRHKDGVKIEAGCFCGNSIEFLERSENEGKCMYVAVVGAVVNALLALYPEQKDSKQMLDDFVTE